MLNYQRVNSWWKLDRLGFDDLDSFNIFQILVIHGDSISQMLHGAGICTNIYPNNHPNVGKYTMHGAYGYGEHHLSMI
jgi:hypothetical protein